MGQVYPSHRTATAIFDRPRISPTSPSTRVSSWVLGKLDAVHRPALAANLRLETRLRKETALLIEELLAGWRELGGR